MLPLKSTAAAEALGVPYYSLHYLVRSGKVPPPARDTSGDFVWTERDLQRARRALERRKAVSRG
jgi:DNA-binding transcriptional MerR regulator